METTDFGDACSAPACEVLRSSAQPIWVTEAIKIAAAAETASERPRSVLMRGHMHGLVPGALLHQQWAISARRGRDGGCRARSRKGCPTWHVAHGMMMHRLCLPERAHYASPFRSGHVGEKPCSRQRQPFDSPLRRNRSDGAPRAIGRVMTLAGLLAGGSRPLLCLPDRSGQWRI